MTQTLFEETAPTVKTRKVRSDKGAHRKRPPLVIQRMVPQESPILAIVDGEEIRCEAWSIENGFLKFRYWPEQRGRIGTRMISLSQVKDFRVEEPQQMQGFPTLNVPSFSTPQVQFTNNAPPQNQTFMGSSVSTPQFETNPLIAARSRDPKILTAEHRRDPMGMRPMTVIETTDERGNIRKETIEAGMQ